MGSINTCRTCGNSDIEAIEKVALAIQQRHDDGSSFEREWTNHHGLMRCDCAELIEFIRGRDKTFWDGMNRSLEQAEGPDEIYQGRLDRDARNYPSKSVLRRLEKTTGIKTQAGLEMFEYFNANYGSNVRGKVLEGIKAIEEELK